MEAGSTPPTRFFESSPLPTTTPRPRWRVCSAFVRSWPVSSEVTSVPILGLAHEHLGRGGGEEGHARLGELARDGQDGTRLAPRAHESDYVPGGDAEGQVLKIGSFPTRILCTSIHVTSQERSACFMLCWLLEGGRGLRGAGRG